MADVDALFIQVKRRMIENGDWNKLQVMLAHKLNENGTHDEVTHRSKESMKTSLDAKFTTVLHVILENFEMSVSLTTKQETLDAIRESLNGLFET